MKFHSLRAVCSFPAEYFTVFSRIWRISRLKIPSKSFPFRLLRHLGADYKNSLK